MLIRILALALFLALVRALPPPRREPPCAPEPAPAEVPRRAAATLDEAHRARRADDRPRALSLYARVAMEVDARQEERAEARYWSARMRIEEGDAAARTELFALVREARSPDLALRAAAALVAFSRGESERRAAVDAVSESIAERTKELTADGRRWSAALRRLVERVR